MSCNLREYKEFIDNEMLLILGQMDKATLIFDHLYLVKLPPRFLCHPCLILVCQDVCFPKKQSTQCEFTDRAGRKKTNLHACTNALPCFLRQFWINPQKKKILLVIENTKTLQISSQMVRRASLQHLHYVNKHTQETADMINCQDLNGWIIRFYNILLI